MWAEQEAYRLAELSHRVAPDRAYALARQVLGIAPPETQCECLTCGLTGPIGHAVVGGVDRMTWPKCGHWVSWGQDDKEVMLPVVGGRAHGQIWQRGPGPQLFDVERTGDEFAQIVYEVREVCVTLPGRTAPQVFRVLVHPSAEGDAGVLRDAVLRAWSMSNWDPGDSTFAA
jgi:hypothetical protein